MKPQVLSPGALLPFSGRGSSNEHEATALNWAIASNGLMEFVDRVPLDRFVWERGRGPYGRCAASGYLAARGTMAKVDGVWYIPEFAPRSREEI